MSKYWKIPPIQNAAFVAAMEDILSVYRLPYDVEYPVICMDESSKQLIGEVRQSLGCKPGKTKKIDDEYVRYGVAQIFMEVEPVTGRRHVTVTERRTNKDWAKRIKALLDDRYPHVRKIRLIMDNLNTHTIGSLYETYPPEEAHRLASRLEIHYTPKHGSWLNIAEIELSALKGQCLDRRICDMEVMREEIRLWEESRNNQAKKINWQFTTQDARIKLKRLYPKF